MVLDHPEREPASPVRRAEKLSQVVAREIVRDMKGLKAAAMLPQESVMLERYRVGRASLREALRILEVHGLIVIRAGPGGGPMVAPVRTRDFARMTSPPTCEALDASTTWYRVSQGIRCSTSWAEHSKISTPTVSSTPPSLRRLDERSLMVTRRLLRRLWLG